MKKIFYASKKLLVPCGEGGGEVIAFDLLSEIERKQQGLVKAFGSFEYLKLERLTAQLHATKTSFHLAQEGAECASRDGQKFTYPSFAHVTYTMPGAYATTLARDDHYFISLDHYLGQYKPDICLLQAEGYYESWQMLQHIPACKTFLYVQNGYEVQRFKEQKVKLPLLLANSKFVQNKVRSENGLHAELLYPAICADRYVVKDDERKPHARFTVLFINPVPVKGLEIFIHMARHMPDVQFIVVEGWGPISQELYELFQRLKNIQYVPKTWNMREVYQAADLLIAPSQWEEAFGRVVVEAHAARLPTLVSDIGGLPEASGEAGFIEYDYRNPDAWVRHIRHLMNNLPLIEEKRVHFSRNVGRFDPAALAQRFMELAG